jgi:uncharacterized protein YndB with AHSA1/START domain
MAAISYDVRTKAAPGKVYAAVSTQDGYAGWWCRTCDVDSRAGGEAEFRFYQSSAVMTFQFDRLERDRAVTMACIRTKSTNPAMPVDKWKGTTMEWTIAPLADGGSDVRFEHGGWADGPWLQQIHQVWGNYIESLKSYLETGTGKPYDDPK